ncbi:helix-turn-helix transcriptional regulator [Sedimentibacter sp. zth1]|uniref:helix-turn-helix domain-containing protein n=1 Tax=Sedimentibacter sp. zth1 TaxID=2816908 RepID=UPI001A91B2D7|nr:helix-turn-helix transcriptional regulator [Sedimentibacter sp. zth1]QSX05334.1 helix-turn-helix transcriptional regulator [Sedimentibacter sp. zth1]
MNIEVMTSGDKLKKIRKKYGIKQYEISRNDISRNMISMIETNKANLIESTAKKIIKNIRKVCKEKSIECDVSLDYLLESVNTQVERIANNFITLIDANPKKISEENFQNYLSKVICILNKYNYKKFKSTIYKKLGDYYKKSNDYYMAYSYYLMSFENFTEMLNNINLVNLIISINYCSAKINKMKESLEFSNLARIYMPSMPLEQNYKIYYNDVIAFKQLKNYDKCLENIYCIENKFIDILNSNITRKTNVMILKANCYCELKSYKKALQIHKQTLFLAKDNIEIKLLTLVNILDIYKKLNDTKGLIKNLEIAILYLENYLKTDSNKYICEFYNDIGEAFYFLKEYDKSKFYLNKSLFQSIRCNKINIIKNCFHNLLNIYILENNENEINSLKNQLLELISTEILPYNSDLLFIFINHYSNIKDVNAVNDITTFIISKIPSK